MAIQTDAPRRGIGGLHHVRRTGCVELLRRRPWDRPQQVLKGAVAQRARPAGDERKADVAHVIQMTGPGRLENDRKQGGEQPLGGAHGIVRRHGQQVGQLQPAGFDQQDGKDERPPDAGLP